MKNKLVVIGWMGTKVAFLNVDREEAIRRAREEHDFDLDPEHHLHEFEFTDVFGVYDAYEV